MRRLPMRKIAEALRLRAAGLSTRKIAASLSVGQSTVAEYLKCGATNKVRFSVNQDENVVWGIVGRA
jgi:predicted transcriptional regulator